jgi:dihydroneopterin aldolase
MQRGDRIELRGLRAFGRHGVLPHEQELGQAFLVDVALEADLSAAARSDALADTVDYGKLGGAVVEAVAGTRFDLLEALAGHLADLVLAEDRVTAVTVTVHKPMAPMGVLFDDVAVTVHRARP